MFQSFQLVKLDMEGSEILPKIVRLFEVINFIKKKKSVFEVTQRI